MPSPTSLLTGMPHSAAAMMLAAGGLSRLPLPPPPPQPSSLGPSSSPQRGPAPGSNTRLGRPPSLNGGGSKLSRMGQGQLTCNCGQIFPNLDVLERHMVALHPENTNLVSNQKSSPFNSFVKLKKLVSREIGGGQLTFFFWQLFSLSVQPCTVCGKQFPNLTKLQRHMANHAEGPETRKFKCSRCGKAFKFKHHLKVSFYSNRMNQQFLF